MQHHSTPGTPGGTTNLPITGHCNAWMQRSTIGSMRLIPGGMLYAVRITAEQDDREFQNADITFELTDEDHVALYADVHKPSFHDAPWWIDDILMLLPEPIPNVNAALPYVLMWKSDTEFGIRSVTLYHRWD
jgi:hypothetical protein